MEGDKFQFSTEHSGFSIFIAERTKKVHFIRHAEGYHNQAAKETGSNDCLIDNQAMWDARLTPHGIEQVSFSSIINISAPLLNPYPDTPLLFITLVLEVTSSFGNTSLPRKKFYTF